MRREPDAKAVTDILDGRDTEADAFLRALDDVLLDNTYRRARETLTGIRATVERTGWVTPRQRQAVRNIVREFQRRP